MSQDVINCPACQRRTPAARGTCLYCGAELPLTKIETAPPQRNLDNYERAFNTILLPSGYCGVEAAESALASALQVETAEARAFIAANKPLPIARSQTRSEAEMIAALIRSCGLGAEVIADEDLKVGAELIRARRIVRAEGELQIHHMGGAVAVPRAEIKLLVVGALSSTRVDYIESKAGGGQSGNVLDSSEFLSEERLLDVYGSSFDISFRIKSDAFDYSGLVYPLSFRAEENFQRALTALHEAAPAARVDEDFARVRDLLARAWPERSRTEARGVKRAGLAYRPVAKSSVISNNRDQFERYSRLMFLKTVVSCQ